MTRKPKCPKCGSENIAMFTDNDDHCLDCGITFSAVIFGRTPEAQNLLLKEAEKTIKAIQADRDKWEKAARELIEMIDNMHKPEYACFFIGEPATDEDNQMNGYELATKYREILGIPEP